MQKIHFYLVPNRITVTTDVVGYSTEYRKVYQRKIKLYKGIDNNIELEVRQGDQRRMTVVGYTAVLKFFDAKRKNLFTVLGEPILSKTGLISVSIPKAVLENIDPQQMSVAAFLRDTNNKESILYADSQFDLHGFVELYNGYNDAGDVIDIAKTWIYDMGSKDLVSEIVDFGTKINDDYSTYPTSSALITVITNPDTPYSGPVTVEATDDKSLALGNRWSVLGTIDFEDFVSGKRFTGEWRFIRFRYPKWVNEVTQKETTGLVDKIVVTN